MLLDVMVHCASKLSVLPVSDDGESTFCPSTRCCVENVQKTRNIVNLKNENDLLK